MNYTRFFILIALISSCQRAFDEPEISLKDYQIEAGFDVEVIASEPLLIAPVAIDFDAKGRIWVAQMPGYMNDLLGSDEDKPVGSIKILEDLDNDGIIDHAKTFLDSLVMPRALAHVYGGLLYAEPPYLYFTTIENDKPVNRVIVDSLYAADGNPEHQPNGLLLNIDNWIYNAKSNFRYQRKNGVWKKEPTTFRGQWGISNDNFGRLYYNNNSQQLLGDHVLPNRLIRNPHFTPKLGVRQRLTKDQRVYPLHETLVNRGYSPGVLNADSILVNTTAAAGLAVYRGGIFPDGYQQNVFVSIPEGNLIKRNVLTFFGDSTGAEQAWTDKEFLASKDVGFRPVNINNGPDGNLYIVDMHRGVTGHHAYLSPYFKKKNTKIRLDTITNYGRILRVQPTNAEQQMAIDFDALNAEALVRLLESKNGWIRNRAQHHLMYKNKTEVLAEVKHLALHSKNELAKIHALYVLEGWNALDFNFLRTVSRNGTSQVIAHALILMESFAEKGNVTETKELFKDLISKEDTTIDLYLCSVLGSWMKVSQEAFLQHWLTLWQRKKKRPIYKEALLSGLDGIEVHVKEMLQTRASFDDPELLKTLNGILQRKENNTVNAIFTRKSLSEDTRTAGAKMYFQICASCHGSNGEGIQGLAPPLNRSEHVADPERLALIILHGLQGPVHVGGTKYEFNLAMPGLLRNDEISDKNIADIIAYVTNAFSDDPKGLKQQQIKKLRTEIPKSGMEYTEAELLEFVKK